MEQNVEITQDVTVEVSHEVTVSDYVDISVDVDVSVEEFYDAMTPTDMQEMATMLHSSGSMDLMSILIPSQNNMFSMNSEQKEKFYKDLAYHVGMTDSQYLDELIENLSYWKRER